MQIVFGSFRQKICTGAEQNFAKVEDETLNSETQECHVQSSSALDKINVLTFLFC